MEGSGKVTASHNPDTKRGPAKQATLLDAALASLGKGAAGRTHFSFVVIGDSRSWEPITQPAIFLEMMREANLLRAAFIVHLGDFIGGYTFDRDLLNRQWDEFEKVVRASEIPLIPMVGNHEVTAPMHEAVYQERVGRLYFSFDFGNSHFICLDTEQVGHFGGVGPEQMGWLRDDLEAAKQEHLFVFLHCPLWHQPEVWEPVHGLLARHNVEVVISGHRHGFELFPERDGIRYFTSAGGGSGFVRGPDRGGFHHFLWVTMEGAQVHYALVKPGAVLPVDIVSDAEAATIPRLETEFDPREVNLLAEAMTQVLMSPQGPVTGAAELAREAEGNLRRVALALLAHLAQTDLVTDLAALIEDPDTVVAEGALEALMGSQHPGGRRIAEGLLNSSDGAVARRAALALAQIDRRFPARLREVVADPRRAAQLTAETIGDLVESTKTHLTERMCDAAQNAFPEAELREVVLRIRWHRARALVRAERYHEALTILDEILAPPPKPDLAKDLLPDSLLLKARCLAALGQKQEALALCKQLQQEFGQLPAAARAAELAENLQG